MVKFPFERNIMTCILAAMRHLLEFVKKFNLMDMPFSRGEFIWSGGTRRDSHSRLDHFLVASDWEHYYSNLV